MSTRLLCALLSIAALCCYRATGWGQSVPPAVSLASTSAASGQLPPEAIAARKAAVKTRLEALEQTPLPANDVEATRAVLTQLLTALTALEEAGRQRATFLALNETVPQQLRDLEQERTRLSEASLAGVPSATPALREQHAADLRTAQTTLTAITAQAEADERRLVAITKDLEQRAATREQIEKELLSERSKTGDQSRALAVEVLTVKSQVAATTSQALETEREWLTRRRSIHDAQLAVERLRIQGLQQRLDNLTRALETALQQEQAALQGKEERLAQEVERTDDPVEALRLTWQQEHITVRKVIADYQEQRHSLGEAVREQERRNTQEKQAQERLAGLINKYADSSAVAQRFALEFARLRRQRVRYSAAPITVMEERVRTLTDAMLLLDERLYTFDDQVETRLAEVTQALQRQPPQEREAAVQEARQELNHLKAGLREQQQELTELLQETSRLVSAHREYRRLLDAGYHFVLTNIFWLRNVEPMGRSTLDDLTTGLYSTGQRLYAFVNAEHRQIVKRLNALPSLWLVLLVVLPSVLFVASWAYRRLGVIESELQAVPPPYTLFSQMASAGLLILRGAIWPAALGLFVWWREVLFASSIAQSDLEPALMRALFDNALVLWGVLVGHALFRRHGWAQWAWDLPVELRRALWRLVILSGLAVWVLLVPQQILLMAPGEGAVGAGSVALARGLFLALQVVLLFLFWMAGRRRSPMVQRLLESSAQRHGLLWRSWPLLWLLLLLGIVAIMLLEILGYDYAARFLWSRTLVSLGIGLGVLGLLRPLGLRASQWLVQTLGARIRYRQSPPPESRQAAAQRSLGVLRLLWHVLSIVVTGGLILSLWGVAVTWIATAPMTIEVVSRLAIFALTVGLVVLLIQASRALTDYLLRPRYTPLGQQREIGRKLRTLAPLVQAIIRVGAIFVAGLVLLEQLGVATAPLLTGVGIFGLAVGFASQSLIKDVINGLFLLFEDSLSVGDVVILRGTGGLVEKVTLRTVTLRDLSGNVHIIPNSTIEMVTNMTMGYSFYLFNVPVAYNEDVDRVITLLQELGNELRQDPAYASDILEPLEVLGLDRFEASAMVIQARLKTRPIRQWRVGREFHRRMKKAFDEHGIVMPLPHQVLSGWVRTHPMDGPLER